MLIEDGILRGYLQDRLNSGLMKMAPTGNGRREGYASIPLPRMTNTFMLAGQDDPDEIVRSVPRGLYAKHFGGGQVDITSGKFVFSATEAYLIEDGRIGAPVFGATLIGNGPDVLTKVTRIGHDLRLDEGVGTCQKAGQSVPVGVGLPTILVSEITVGGTADWRSDRPRCAFVALSLDSRVVLDRPPCPDLPGPRGAAEHGLDVRCLDPLPPPRAQEEEWPPDRASEIPGLPEPHRIVRRART